MTSNGQHAGQRRSDQTSSVDGPPDDPQSHGFPPDVGDGQSPPSFPSQQPAWGPAAYPNSYGPPPYPAQSDGASPFVVPAVPVFAPSKPDVSAGPTNQPGGPLPEPSGAEPSPPPYTFPSAAATPFGGRATPTAFGAAPGASASATDAAWAPVPPPNPAPPLAAAPPATTTPGLAPAPQLTPAPAFGNNAAEPGTTTFGSPAAGSDPGTTTGSRPPGVSAFGSQRIRVPGATLASLPDAPPEVMAPFSGESSTGASAQAGPGRQTSNGLPVRGGTALDPWAAKEPGAVPPHRHDGNPYAGSAAPAIAPPRTGGFGAATADPAALPQPRTPAEPEPGSHQGERPHGAGPHSAGVSGSARPISASASVPMTSRVAPPAEAYEPAAGVLAPRVYGRPAPTEPSTPAAPEQRTSAPQPPTIAPPPIAPPAIAPPAIAAPGIAPPAIAPPIAPATARGTVTARATPPPTNSLAGYGASSPSAFSTGAPTGFAPGSPAPFASGPPAPPFSEHTTDLAGRDRAIGQQYGSAPAGHLTTPSADNRTSSFPGQAGRATVTPPGPAVPAGWPEPAADGDQGRFAAFKPTTEAAAEAAPATEPEAVPQVRRVLVTIMVALVSALIVGGALGAVWLVARPSSSAFDISPGQCVKREGDKAVTATCGDTGSFEVVSKVETKEQCADPGQPHVLNPIGNGRNQVLCLKPRA